MAKCFSCGAEIVWALTEKGKRMPVDAEPVADGNLELDVRTDPPLAIVHGQPTLDGGPRYVSHFATCPNADRHRQQNR